MALSVISWFKWRPTIALLSSTLLFVTPKFHLLAQNSKETLSGTQQEDDIREAVLRSQMNAWIASGDKSVREAKDASAKKTAERLNFKEFYISIDGKDPADDFLARCKDIPRTVLEISSSKIDNEHRFTVVNKKTHRPGIVFYVEKLHWKSSTDAEIDGGYDCDGRCAVGITFQLKLVNGKWKIQSERKKWIS